MLTPVVSTPSLTHIPRNRLRVSEAPSHEERGRNSSYSPRDHRDMPTATNLTLWNLTPVKTLGWGCIAFEEWWGIPAGQERLLSRRPAAAAQGRLSLLISAPGPLGSAGDGVWGVDIW